MDKPEKPEALVVTLAAGAIDREWFVADEVLGALKRMGHEFSSQKVAGMLRYACGLDAPPIESRKEPHWPTRDYHVTPNGRNWLSQKFPGLCR